MSLYVGRCDTCEVPIQSPMPVCYLCHKAFTPLFTQPSRIDEVKSTVGKIKRCDYKTISKCEAPDCSVLCKTGYDIFCDQHKSSFLRLDATFWGKMKLDYWLKHPMFGSLIRERSTKGGFEYAGGYWDGFHVRGVFNIGEKTLMTICECLEMIRYRVIFAIGTADPHIYKYEQIDTKLVGSYDVVLTTPLTHVSAPGCDG